MENEHKGNGFLIETGAALGCFVGTGILVFVIWLLAQLPWLFSTLATSVENKMLLGLIGATIASAIGTALYFLRKNRRMLYAITEIAFAIATAWTAANRVTPEGDLSVWLAIGASTSLVVAGLENIQVAKKEK